MKLSRTSKTNWTVAAGLLAVISGGIFLQGFANRPASTEVDLDEQFSINETAKLTFAPDVPPPITRRRPAVVRVDLEATEEVGTLMEGIEKPTQYRFWTFNGRVPGPMIRCRVGDMLEVHLANRSSSQMPHNIDLHAVTGPGGGAAVTIAQPGQVASARFRLLNPGLYVYHCAVPPVPHHVANGMYGLILVEPEEGLPPVDKEFYIMQSEFYTKNPFGTEGLQEFSPEKLRLEQPDYIVFNGKVGALMDTNSLKANVGDKVRLYVGNGGPDKVSSFHVIGTIFDTVWPEGSTSNPETNVQTTVIPPGGSAVCELQLKTAGDYTIVDHAISRIEIGALGLLQVQGAQDTRVYEPFKY